MNKWNSGCSLKKDKDRKWESHNKKQMMDQQNKNPHHDWRILQNTMEDISLQTFFIFSQEGKKKLGHGLGHLPC